MLHGCNYSLKLGGGGGGWVGYSVQGSGGCQLDSKYLHGLASVSSGRVGCGEGGIKGDITFVNRA